MRNSKKEKIQVQWCTLAILPHMKLRQGSYKLKASLANIANTKQIRGTELDPVSKKGEGKERTSQYKKHAHYNYY